MDQCHTRELHDLTIYKRDIDDVFDQVIESGTKIASGAGVRVGGSAVRNNISKYRYINTKAVLLKSNLKKTIYSLIDLLNLKSDIITHNILHFEPGEFLDWQDYYMWSKKCQFSGSMMIRGPVIKFFSISMTDDNVIKFKDQEISVPKYHGLSFQLADVHCVEPVNKSHYWLVLGVPKHIDINSKIYH
jgi:hypothetical protein